MGNYTTSPVPEFKKMKKIDEDSDEVHNLASTIVEKIRARKEDEKIIHQDLEYIYGGGELRYLICATGGSESPVYYLHESRELFATIEECEHHILNPSERIPRIEVEIYKSSDLYDVVRKYVWRCYQSLLNIKN